MAFTFAEITGGRGDERLVQLFLELSQTSPDFPWRVSRKTIVLRPELRGNYWVEITESDDGSYRVEFREPAM